MAAGYTARPWQGGPMHRPFSAGGYNMHHRTRANVPRPSVGGGAGGAGGQRMNTPQTQRIAPQQRLNPQGRPGGAQQPKLQFSAGARNQPGPMSGGGMELGQDPEPLSTLSQTDPMKRKQIIGEHLYRAISASHPDKAGKITGMLLEMDNSELLHMLEAPESLNSKVEEAVNVLREHEQQQQQMSGKYILMLLMYCIVYLIFSSFLLFQDFLVSLIFPLQLRVPKRSGTNLT